MKLIIGAEPNKHVFYIGNNSSQYNQTDFFNVNKKSANTGIAS